MSCPQDAAYEHIGPCEFFYYVYYFYFSVALKSLSMPFYLFIFPFSYYLVILFISSFLFTSCASVTLQIFLPLGSCNR